MRFASLSMHSTLTPNSAKQAPVTNPTYPVPMTLICLRRCLLYAMDQRSILCVLASGKEDSCIPADTRRGTFVDSFQTRWLL
jgi:hypothetical protein